MKALWLEDRSLRFETAVAPPSPASGEAVVRVTCAGICNTDLELVRGYYPYTGIPGHEFVGVVDSASDATWVGQRVVGEINATCGGTCDTCRAGRPTHCESRTVLGIVSRNGAFAERLALPLANLHAVPARVPDEVAVFTEPLAAALEIQQQVSIGPGMRVVVIGDGKLGNLIAQTLVLTGCELLVIGRNPAKLDLLAARGIPTATGDGMADRRADLVVECTGNPEGLVLARRAVRPRGTIVLKSTYAGAVSIDLSGVVVDEITLLGSRCGPFAPALDLLARDDVDVRPLIHGRYPLEGGVEAFAHAARPGVLKVLVTP
jgi:threonine dehydrogenase-like Zn-dependent dehydrogenase